MTGDELKQRRKEWGLTQDLLARELGVSRPTISAWEKLGEDKIDRLVFLAIEALTKHPELQRVVQDGVRLSRGADS